MNLSELSKLATDQFQRRFQRGPEWIVAAPGRVNIIGEHTDYNDGYVMPMAIERWTVLAAAPGAEQCAHVFSEAMEESAAIDLSKAVAPGLPKWANYVRGVIAGFQRLGKPIAGFNAVMHSTVPLGSGLSSSAALEVATATLLEAVLSLQLDPVDKALLCQKAEHEFAGVPCGIMDQFTSTLAQENHLLLLDCRSRQFELVRMNDPGISVLIINTNVRHELASGEYGRRRSQCETAAKALGVPSLRDASMAMLAANSNKLEPVVFRRARHVITEIDRTVFAARAIPRSDWDAVGQLMYASHASLRDDYEVSCSELDAVVGIARSIGRAGGMIGCRMTGGGFGGCAVALVEAAHLNLIKAKVSAAYRSQTGIDATLFESGPAAGAQALKS